MIRIGALGALQLAEQDRAGLAQFAHDSGIFRRVELLVNCHSGRRRHVPCPAQVLHRNGDTVQWSADRAAHDVRFGCAGLCHCGFRHHQGVAPQLAVELFDAGELRRGRFDGRQLPCVKLAGQFQQAKVVNGRGHSRLLSGRCAPRSTRRLIWCPAHDLCHASLVADR
jgi:hypothetical protein